MDGFYIGTYMVYRKLLMFAINMHGPHYIVYYIYLQMYRSSEDTYIGTYGWFLHIGIYMIYRK